MKIARSTRSTRTTRRRVTALLGLAALAATALTPLDAAAQAFPNKPLKLIVNFPPGGAADVMGRALALQLGEQLKQPVVVENRGGANGNIGAEAVAKSPSDGYTLLMSSAGVMTVNPALYSKMPFDPDRDLLPLASVARVSVFLVVHPSVPANNVQELVNHARANPGRLSFGSAGNGSTPHLAGEMFKRAARIEATHVPYKGAAPALTDLLAGQIQFMFDPGPGLRQAKDGKLRLLAVGSPKRSGAVPEAPTMAEAGLAGFDADSVFGLYVPGGTPQPLLVQLHEEVNKALATPKVAEVIKGLGGEPVAQSRAEFSAAMQRDRDRYGVFIKEIGLKVE